MAGVVGISTGEEHTIGLLRNGKAMDICEYCEYDRGQVPEEMARLCVNISKGAIGFENTEPDNEKKV